VWIGPFCEKEILEKLSVWEYYGDPCLRVLKWLAFDVWA